MGTVVEPYFIAQYDRSTVAYGAYGTDGPEEPSTIYMPGILVSTNPLEGLGISVEVAHQTGSLDVTPGGVETQEQVNRNAWAAQFIADYQLPILEEYNPAAKYTYSYASGDRNTENTDSSANAWDPLYFDQNCGTIYYTLFSFTDLHIHRVI